MEELQEALEDAQYVSAINIDQGPTPLVALPRTNEAGLTEWKEAKQRDWQQCNVVTNDGDDDHEKGGGHDQPNEKPHKPSSYEPFSFDWTVSNTIGFFFLSSFLKDEKKDYIHINFIEDVFRFKTRQGQRKGAKLKTIYKKYLLPCEIDSETDSRILPKMTEIDDIDLCVSSLLLDESKTTSFGLNELYANNFDPETKDCCIGICGPVRDEILKTIEEKLTPSTPSNELAEGTPESVKPKQRMTKTEMEIALSKVPSDIFDHSEMIILEHIRKTCWEDFTSSHSWEKMMHLLWSKDQEVREKDFFPIRVLGRGGFGLVSGCKRGTTGALYAMKVMNKKRIKAKKSERFALNERAALSAVDSPFVVSLKYAFQTKSDLYLILDLMTGGDLGYHLSQKGRFSTRECIYYAAGIMLGLQALHDKNYVYRDLKPENCLLSEDGRVRITDLGLATLVTPKLRGAAGTRGYWAPEMLKRDENGKRIVYDQRVDWFSYGCVLAEMISGASPFRTEAALQLGLGHAETKEKAIDYATQHMTPSLKSSRFDENSSDLCLRLLEKDPNNRLGTNGCKEIMEHEYFKSTNWKMLQSGQEKPPFLPAKDINAASKQEIGQFTDDHDSVKFNETDDEYYKDWQWTNPKVYDEEMMELLIYERETGVSAIPLHSQNSCCCSVM